MPAPVSKNSKSRTSSEMLFGENGGSNKKRKTKAGDKIERESMRSDSSKISRNTNGRFTAIPPWTNECKWEPTGEIDTKKRRYYKCACGKVERLRVDNRSRHE